MLRQPFLDPRLLRSFSHIPCFVRRQMASSSDVRTTHAPPGISGSASMGTHGKILTQIRYRCPPLRISSLLPPGAGIVTRHRFADKWEPAAAQLWARNRRGRRRYPRRAARPFWSRPGRCLCSRASSFPARARPVCDRLSACRQIPTAAAPGLFVMDIQGGSRVIACGGPIHRRNSGRTPGRVQTISSRDSVFLKCAL